MAQKWSKEIVARRIRALRRSGKKLNSDYVQKRNRPLYLAAYKYWGGWKQAIEGAGISYDDVRIIGWQKRSRVWSKKKIIAVIRKRYRNREPLNSNHIQTKIPRLYGASCKGFGGWAQAVAASGIDYDTIRIKKLRVWSKKQIVLEIICRSEAGLSIRGGDVTDEDRGLYSAAKRHFGKNGWARARTLAGFTPVDPKPSQIWSKQTVIAEIKRLHENGVALNTGALQESYGYILGAGRKYFGTWAKAVRAAGFNYSKIRLMMPKGWWTKSRILLTIQSLEKRGVRLSSKAIQHSHSSLFSLALVKFGSWSQAVEAAGISYRSHCLNWSTKAWLRRLSDADYKKKLST